MADFLTCRTSKFSKAFTMFSSVILIATLATSSASFEDRLEDLTFSTYDIFYNAGMEAYYQQRWYECMAFMEKAIDDYKNYREGMIDCRMHCHSASSVGGNAGDLLALTFFESALKNSDCLRRCKADKFKNRPEIISAEITDDFDSLKPYDYLQICAYKLGKHEKAVSAAFTFSLANPDHESMKNNIAFYNSLEQVKPHFFKNLEAKKFQDSYLDAVQAYIDGKYTMCIEKMEKAVSLYYKESERCRAACEGPYDHESLPDLYNAIADHWVHTLECQMKCSVKMATINGEILPNYLAEHYNYLQFSYFKVSNMKKAAESTETYLMFVPGDEVMSTNKQYYMTLAQVKLTDFTVREDAIAYQKTQQMLKEMSKYVKRKYTFSEADVDSKGAPVRTGDSRGILQNNVGAEILPDAYGHPVANSQTYGERDEKFLKELRHHSEELGVNITLEADGLSGKHRVAIDGLLTGDQCQSLMQLADTGATIGDGYRGKDGQTSPHTNYELFAGLTVTKAAELAKQGAVKESEAKLYLQASEKSRAYLERYYNLQRPLYFHYTHLVCRTAIEGANHTERGDLSHPVHADNCHIQEDGSCLKYRPAYVWRDFTALVYLNDDFEGGDFFWSYKNLTVQQRVRPRCGRMVGFEGSDYHGVQALTKGKRCALAIWFTLDPSYQETSHGEASAMLSAMPSVQTRVKENPNLKTMMDKEKFELSLTEEELNGPERFMADKLVTDEECSSLIKLTNDGALVGDGYQHGKGKTSPHTDKEEFAGLTVLRAGQEGAIVGDGYAQVKGRKSPHTDNEQYAGMTMDYAGKDGGLKGDGYMNSQGSPHTDHEMFEGLTILRSAQLAADHKVDPEAVRLYLDLSQKSLEVVKAYFKIDKPLYFDYTHLVCRTALDESNTDRTDLSHPIHSDNCVMQPDHSCIRVAPAYVQRDYSALLYLNGEFEGGEFFFAHTNFSVQAMVRPKCGRLVGFNAGIYHGVKAVLSGQRCAIAMWYTLDPKFKETGQGIARHILEDLKRQKSENSNSQDAKLVGPNDRLVDEL